MKDWCEPAAQHRDRCAEGMSTGKQLPAFAYLGLVLDNAKTQKDGFQPSAPFGSHPANGSFGSNNLLPRLRQIKPNDYTWRGPLGSRLLQAGHGREVTDVRHHLE